LDELDSRASKGRGRAVVVHDGVAVRAALGVPAATALFAEWRREGMRVLAPDVWVAEAVSAIRRSVAQRVLSRADGKAAVARLFALGIESVALDLSLSRQGFDWAERLGASRVHDAFFVALAERCGGSLWTANRRLALRARQSGASWVHYLRS
jgi:predicted nucleic acid-binding protein